MSNHIVQRVMAESGCTMEQVQRVVTAALRELHLVAATDKYVTTGAVMECRWNFGTEACYHLGGILMYHDDKTNAPGHVTESLMPETMARFLGCGEEIEAITQRWGQHLDLHSPQRSRERL